MEQDGSAAFRTTVCLVTGRRARVQRAGRVVAVSLPSISATIGSARQASAQQFNSDNYLKYLFVENAAKTGGFAVMGGIGGTPGYYAQGELTNSFETYWAAAPVTLPFLRGKVLWDLMPGFSIDLDRGQSGKTSSSFTYSTRVAVYGVIPRSAIVGEAYGSKGNGVSQAEYKAGVRWEPTPSFALAATYGDAFDHSGGAGFEVGFLLFTPRFLCKGGCK